MLDGGPGFELDIDAVKQNVDEAEIVSLFFPLIRKTLLLDTRSDSMVGPMVTLVDMVQNASQRFSSLHKMRPGLPRPESITMIPWARPSTALRTTGVWEHVTARLETCGDHRCVDAANRCLAEIRRLERHELGLVLSGDGYRTLWGRLGVGDTEA